MALQENKRHNLKWVSIRVSLHKRRQGGNIAYKVMTKNKNLAYQSPSGLYIMNLFMS